MSDFGLKQSSFFVMSNNVAYLEVDVFRTTHYPCKISCLEEEKFGP